MAYESLINQAKDYLRLDNSAFEEYYKKAAQNLQESYDKSLSQLEKQYTQDKNAAASQSMLNKRNMDQYLAARGLSRSGESVQEQINSNISLSNTLNSLADTNARQITELEKSKNADLLELEEKRLEHKNANDKWNAEQENKRLEAAEQREYETKKIASQREYEDAVRKAEHELEAQIRAEKARTDAEKAAKDQQYKLDYYRIQQADKERLIAEERAYNESKKDDTDGTSTDTSPELSGLSNSEKNYVTNISDKIISSATDGSGSIKTAKQRVTAYRMLEELKSNGTPPKYLKLIESNLVASGYSAPSDAQIRESELLDRLDKIYDMAYNDAMTMLASQNINAVVARPTAVKSAENSQLAYLYKHCSSLDAFYEMAVKAGLDRNQAYKFILNQKKN